VFDGAAPGSVAVFVWDDAYLQQMDYGFKRLLFIYETLLELDVCIVRGDLVDCLGRLAREQGGRIRVPETPNPRLQQIAERLRDEFEVDVIAELPFVSLTREPDLGRFFRYWNKARGAAMKPGGGAGERC
jgi:hypothetical protein